MLHDQANSCDRPQFVGLRNCCRMDWYDMNDENESVMRELTLPVYRRSRRSLGQS